jgi:NADPH-ferrihemoprotein reductase
MDDSSSAALFDTTDLILLSAIGLGTVAWFSRHQIANLIFKPKETKVATTSAAPKRETNFVKVMEQQVSIYAIAI